MAKRKTVIVTTKKHGSAGQPGAKRLKDRKKAVKTMTKQVRRKHSGYSMKGILKGQMTYKRKGRKR